ncbi:unnamed protein product [Ixodes persulcatus]
MEVADLISSGKHLGLEGEALREWVDHERELLRQRAEREREARAEDRNAAREVARAREEAECCLMELKIRLEETQLKLQEAQNTAPAPLGSVEEGTGRTLGKSPQRWLPPFDEWRDDLEAHLLRFERLATGQRWPREQWATTLSVCLTGEALGVFSRLTPDDSVVYDKVKKALLQRFHLTAEGFREKTQNRKGGNRNLVRRQVDQPF